MLRGLERKLWRTRQVGVTDREGCSVRWLGYWCGWPPRPRPKGEGLPTNFPFEEASKFRRCPELALLTAQRPSPTKTAGVPCLLARLPPGFQAHTRKPICCGCLSRRAVKADASSALTRLRVPNGPKQAEELQKPFFEVLLDMTRSFLCVRLTE